jgi:hypothetical protein
MTYITVKGDWYKETDTFVVDRTEFTDEFNLTFNPSEYIEAYFGGLTSLYERVAILVDTEKNVIFWKYQTDDNIVKNLIVFNH